MGLSVSTTNTFEYVFVEDRTLPADDQRTLICKFLSARDYNRATALFDEATEQVFSENGKLSLMASNVIEGLRLTLVGWRNFGVDFSLDSIDEALAIADLNDVRKELLHAMTISHIEKKASALRAQSTTGNSANAGPTVA
jgi:hypothetical protein